MELQFHGANCVTLATKQARVVVDDNLADLGGKPVAKSGDIVLHTQAGSGPEGARIDINQPGEYEVAGVHIYGIRARAHMDEEGQKTATIYKLLVDDLRVVVTGHIYPELDDDLQERIGMVDVLIVPVGGNGYTLDPVGALKVIKELSPKLVIPTHYDVKGLNYPVPQVPLADALKGLSFEPKETTDKLRLKSSDLGEVTQAIVLTKV